MLRTRICVVSIAVVACAGCGTRTVNPVAASATAVSTSNEVAPDAIASPAVFSSRGSARIDICHRTDGANAYVPMAVPPAALTALLAHGDVRVGDAVPGQPGMKFGSDCTPVPLVPVTISFDGLAGSGNLSPLTTYMESGLTVSPVSGSWTALTSYGNPEPSIIFTRLASEPTLTAEVQVTNGGAPFVLTSVDLYSSVTQIPYTLSGSLGSTPVFTTSATLPNTYGNFVTVVNPYGADLIDTLSITVSNPATPCCDNPAGLDNITIAR